MLTFRLNGRPHQLPQAWAELSAKQVLALAPYLVVGQQPTAAGRLAVLRLLCPALKARVLRRMAPDDVLDLSRRVEWVWAAPMGECPLRSFTHAGTEYLLFEPVFGNCVATEYLMAEHHFRHFARPQPVPDALEQLVATLCRPRKAGLDELDPHWDGDRRERYNAKVAEARARQLRTLPLATKLVVLQYYVASARAFHERYRELYRRPQPGRPTREGAASFGLLGILDDVATEGVFGTWEQTCYTNVHQVFFHLLKGHRETQAQRRQAAE